MRSRRPPTLGEKMSDPEDSGVSGGTPDRQRTHRQTGEECRRTRMRRARALEATQLSSGLQTNRRANRQTGMECHKPGTKHTRALEAIQLCLRWQLPKLRRQSNEY